VLFADTNSIFEQCSTSARKAKKAQASERAAAANRDVETHLWEMAVGPTARAAECKIWKDSERNYSESDFGTNQNHSERKDSKRKDSENMLDQTGITQKGKTPKDF
jgi:hypothetical protein